MLGRSEKSIRNVSVGLIIQCLELCIKFVSRTIFIKFLAIEYLGVNGLFSEILTVFSLSELGIASAIIYELYQPLKEGATKQILALVHFFKRAYIGVGCFIAVSGLLLVPFLRYIIKDPGVLKDEIITIYLFFLFNTSITYFFSYRFALVEADQKSYIITIFRGGTTLLRFIFQTIALVYYHNFYLYLLVESFFIVLYNGGLSCKIKRSYPYLKDINKYKLKHEDVLRIFCNIKACFLAKVSTIIVNSTDNLLVSILCGISMVGLYSNYALFLLIFNSLLGQLSKNVAPSIGNLNANGNVKQSYAIFQCLNMVNFWFHGFVGIGYGLLVNDVLTVWIGEKYVISSSLPYILALNFYVKGMQNTIWVFKDSFGLFRYGQYLTLVQAGINLSLSIWWGKLWGVAGIFIATIVARLLITVWYDAYALFKHGLKMPVWNYYKYYARYMILFLSVFYFYNRLIKYIELDGWGSFFVRFAVVALGINILFLLFLCKTREFNSVKMRLISLAKERFFKN